MLKKRVIFTLLFADGSFMLSRNFRLQRVGDIDWLQRNYNFSDVAFYIDELVVLDVSRGKRDFDLFCETLRQIARGCFAPIAAGGGLRDLESARQLLRSGADKVILNSALIEDPALVLSIAQEFGQQCVIASLDVKRDSDGTYQTYISNGECRVDASASDVLGRDTQKMIGEIYLNSMERDGTGQGFDFETLDLVPKDCHLPVILVGGVGNARHLAEGLSDHRVDAVATAHLFNFVGDGLKKARIQLSEESKSLAIWPEIDSVQFDHFSSGEDWT